MRCYATPRGPAAWRLTEHVDRLFDSCKIYRMEIPFSRQELKDAIGETVRANGLDACYVRPVVFRGYGTMGVDPRGCPVEVFIAVWPWGAYDVGVSSWTRLAPNTLPTMAKASANYMNSQLIVLEARTNGFVEGIALDSSGFVSEGSGENLFVVRRGRLLTPAPDSSALPGITRDAVMQLARRQGLEVQEARIPRELLYLADELFLSGTAAEVTPVRSVDRLPVGDGKPGVVTRSLQKEFSALTSGAVEDKFSWLTYL
jgi:branched-chain amino acid aminotransferase